MVTTLVLFFLIKVLIWPWSSAVPHYLFMSGIEPALPLRPRRIAGCAMRHPGPGHQLVETRSGPEIDQLREHVGEAGLRVDPVQLAGFHERRDASPVLRPLVQRGSRAHRQALSDRKTIRGQSAGACLIARQARSKPLVLDLKAWFEQQLARVSGKSEIAEAIRYGLNHWDGLTRFLDDGRIELDTNAVERSMRSNYGRAHGLPNIPGTSLRN
jgi:hypothetical protein